MVQIREDLVTQRLPCPTNTLSILCGYWAQSELGDFKCDEIDKKLLLGQFKFVAPRNCRIESEFEEEVCNASTCLCRREEAKWGKSRDAQLMCWLDIFLNQNFSNIVYFMFIYLLVVLFISESKKLV